MPAPFAVPVIRERPRSREFTIGPETGTRVLLYRVMGTSDEAEVETLVQVTAPAFYLGLQFQSYHVTPGDGDESWDVEVQYAKKERKEPGQFSVSFDTGGGTAHITQSKSRHDDNEDNFAPPGKTPPNLKGAIGVTDDAVEGCDVVIPSFTFSETHIVSDSFVTTEFIKLLRDKTGTINFGSFRGFDVGEVLFAGVSGSKRGKDDWELSYKFNAGKDETDLNVGGITVSRKPAWSYIWARYGREVSNNKLIKTPSSVHVEKIYESSDFDEMFPWLPPTPQPPP